MSSLMKRRDVFMKMRTTLKEFFLKSRKEHLINEINNLLRNKFIDEIDVSASLSLLQRVDVLLLTLIVKKQISLTLKEVNIRLNNIERHTTKIIITLIFYAVVTKTNAQREINETTTTIITSYNNINQQKQLKKAKKEKTLIFKIRKQSEKNNLRTLFLKKLIERLQRVEKIKEDVMTTRRFFNENVKLITHSKKVKNRLIINNSLMKNVASAAYAMSRIFEVLIHEMRVIDVQTNNQQKIIRRIEKQNEILHSSLRIAKII
jgi:transcription initiation factor TFIIIB Brf1 subunit/transcription initiation factor TFIIB